MKIIIKSTKLDLPQTLVNYIYEKIESLEKFTEKWDAEGLVEARIEVERTTKHHRKGQNVYRAGCNLRLPKKILRAEHSDWNLRVAIDHIKQELQSQIKEYNSKFRPQDSGDQRELRKLRGK